MSDSTTDEAWTTGSNWPQKNIAQQKTRTGETVIQDHATISAGGGPQNPTRGRAHLVTATTPRRAGDSAPYREHMALGKTAMVRKDKRGRRDALPCFKFVLA